MARRLFRLASFRTFCKKDVVVATASSSTSASVGSGSVFYPSDESFPFLSLTAFACFLNGFSHSVGGH